MKLPIWNKDGDLLPNANWTIEAYLFFPDCERSRQQYLQILKIENTAFLEAIRKNGKATYTPSLLLRTLDGKSNRGFKGQFYTSLMVHAFHMMDLFEDENPSQRKAAKVVERTAKNIKGRGLHITREERFTANGIIKRAKYDLKSSEDDIRARWREHLPVAHLWAAMFSMDHDVLSETTPIFAYPHELTRHFLNHAVAYQKILERVLDSNDAKKLFDVSKEGSDIAADFTFDDCFTRRMSVAAYVELEFEGLVAAINRKQHKLKTYARQHGTSLSGENVG